MRCAAVRAQWTGRDCRLWRAARARGEAHGKHVGHVRDLGRVCEFDLLVEVVRVLPSGARAGHTRCGESCWPGGRGWRVTAWCARSGSAARTQWRGRDCRLGGGPGARGGAHLKHVAHVRDAFRVEFDRLVECRRALCARRVASRARWGRARLCTDLGAQWAHRGTRTSNMSLMSVTLDVSENSIFWLNACASCRGARAGYTVRGELQFALGGGR